MKRYLVKVYLVDVERYPIGRDDIDEEAEDRLDCTRDFQYQVQGNSLYEIAEKLLRSAPIG